MITNSLYIEQAKTVFRRLGGIFRTKEAIAEGVHPRTLYQMRDEGIIHQISRGLYELAEGRTVSHPDIIMVAKKIPEARFCLISALDLHNLTDEIPGSVHIALPKGAWEPKLDYPPIKTFRFSEQTYKSGSEVHSIDGFQVWIYSPAKTIADCFKFRNQIGLDVCIKALKQCIRQKKATFNEIHKCAEICRVTKVITPYMESIGHG